MNETNSSELESSCSTESSLWPAPEVRTPDSGVGTLVGSSTRNSLPPTGDVSDDPEYQALKFRQRVKKTRRNYRTHMDSDSNWTYCLVFLYWTDCLVFVWAVKCTVHIVQVLVSVSETSYGLTDCKLTECKLTVSFGGLRAYHRCLIPWESG